MVNKKLYLSSLDFNPIEADIQQKQPLLLGPWCLVKIRSLSELKDAVENDVSLSPWKKSSDLLPDIDYLRQVVLHLVPWLGDVLNKRHGICMDNYFWRWMLSMWLQHFLHSALEQWKRLELGLSYHEPLDYRAVKLVDCRLPNTLSFVVAAFSSPHFHAALASQIIDFMHAKNFPGSNNLNKINVTEYPALRTLTPCLPMGRALPLDADPSKQSLLRKLYGLAVKMVLPGELLIEPRAFGFGPKEVLLYPFARALEPESPPVNASPALREHQAIQWPGPFEAVDFFEEFVQQAIPDWLPDIFWDKKLFAGLLDNNRKLLEKHSAKKIFFPSASLPVDEQAKAFLVNASRQGGIVVLAQHGSHYGTAFKYPMLEIEEYEQASLFLTWGWDELEKQPGNFMPLPALHLERKARRGTEQDQSILFVTNMRTTYNPRFSSNPVIPEQSVKIIDRQARFFRAFPGDLRGQLLHQAYPGDYHPLAADDILKAEFPWLQSTKTDFFPHYRRCSLLVMDYPGTTLHAALAVNGAAGQAGGKGGKLGTPLPFILFWDPNDELFSGQGAPLFAALADCGILHATPEAAAQAIGEVCRGGTANIMKWWNEPARQEAVQALARQYAMTGPDALGLFKGLLRKLTRAKLEKSPGSECFPTL